MTALNFPPQPQDVGNTYVGGNGVTYVWSGTIWSVAGNPGSTGNVVFAGNTIATASGGNVIIQAGTEDWTFTENGTLLVPSPVSSILLFTLDSSHYVPTEGKPVLGPPLPAIQVTLYWCPLVSSLKRPVTESPAAAKVTPKP